MGTILSYPLASPHHLISRWGFFLLTEPFLSSQSTKYCMYLRSVYRLQDRKPSHYYESQSFGRDTGSRDYGVFLVDLQLTRSSSVVNKPRSVKISFDPEAIHSAVDGLYSYVQRKPPTKRHKSASKIAEQSSKIIERGCPRQTRVPQPGSVLRNFQANRLFFPPS